MTAAGTGYGRGDLDVVRALPFWQGPVEVEPLAGGLTNRNLLVTCRGERFVVRLSGPNARGTDVGVDVHGVDRSLEAAVAAAAGRIGLGPALVHAGPGALVFEHIGGRALDPVDFLRPEILDRSVALLRRCRDEMPGACGFELPARGPALVLADYLDRLPAADATTRWLAGLLERLAPSLAGEPRGFAHNDIHGGNILDDGARLWLIDWEYAGRGMPLMDVASLVNNSADPAVVEAAALRLWGGGSMPARAAFARMRLAAAMRDYLWGLCHPGPGGSLDSYLAVNRRRVEEAVSRLEY